MQEFYVRTLSMEIIFPTIVLICISIHISTKYLTLGQAFFSCIIKYGLFLVYYSNVLGVSWTHLDDITYLTDAYYLMTKVPLSELIFTSDGYLQMMSISGGKHFLYLLWNIIALKVIGVGYYAPVSLNIFVSFLSGLVLYKILIIFKSVNYSRLASLFFILHVDILTWTTIVNVKSSLVILMTLLMFLNLFQFMTRKRVSNILFLVLSAFVLLWLRFYIPVLFFISLFVYFTFVFRNVYFLIFSIVILLCVLGQVESLIRLDLIDPSSLIMGFVRFSLTPLPWSIIDSYSYLKISSIANMVLIIPAVIGAYCLSKNSPIVCIMVVYLLVCWVFYSIVPELQGPRHRAQFVPFISLAQFHFIYLLFKGNNKVRG